MPEVRDAVAVWRPPQVGDRRELGRERVSGSQADVVAPDASRAVQLVLSERDPLAARAHRDRLDQRADHVVGAGLRRTVQRSGRIEIDVAEPWGKGRCPDGAEAKRLRAVAWRECRPTVGGLEDESLTVWRPAVGVHGSRLHQLPWDACLVDDPQAAGTSGGILGREGDPVMKGSRRAGAEGDRPDLIELVAVRVLRELRDTHPVQGVGLEQ